MTKPNRMLVCALLAGLTWYRTVVYGTTNMVNGVKPTCVGRFVVSLPTNATATIDCQVPCDSIEQRIWRFTAAGDAIAQLRKQLVTT